MNLSSNQADVMERIEDVADLPSSRPVLDSLADMGTQLSPITVNVGDTTIYIVRPFESSFCKKVRL